MTEYTAHFAVLMERIATEDGNFIYPAPTQQTLGSPSSVKKAISALNKCVSRGLHDLAHKYANALINGGVAGQALRSLVSRTVEEVEQGPNNNHLCAVLCMLTLAHGESIVGDAGRALHLAIHLITKANPVRTYSNLNIRNSLIIDQAITSEAWLYKTEIAVTQQQMAIDYLKLAKPTSHLTAPSAYKELVFAGMLLRMIQGWVPPATEVEHDHTGTPPPGDWFVTHMKMTYDEAFIHSQAMNLSQPLASLRDYGGLQDVGGMPIDHKVFPVAPQGAGPHVPDMKHGLGGKETLAFGDQWQLLGGVPDFSFDGTTEEGHLISLAMLTMPGMKKLFKGHPLCKSGGQSKIIKYFMAMREQGECTRYARPPEGMRFIQEQHYRFLNRYWGIGAHIDSKHTQDIRNSVNLFSEAMQEQLNMHLYAYRAMAVAKTLKL